VASAAIPADAERGAERSEARPVRTPASVLVRSNMRVRPREAAEPRAVDGAPLVRGGTPDASPPVWGGNGRTGNGWPDGPADNSRPLDAEQPDAPAFTPNGLPRRVRQASLTGPMYDDKPAAAQQRGDDDPVRAPEDVRRMMSSYQTGTKRGRSAAERSVDVGAQLADGDAGDGAGPTDDDSSPTGKDPTDR
jgi:hypothetical protein